MDEIVKDDTQKGVKIQTLSRFSLVVGIILLAFIFGGLYSIVGKYNKLIGNVSLFTESQTNIYDLQRNSDYMTEQVRLYVITSNPVHVDSYFSVIDADLREVAFQNLKSVLKDGHYDSSINTIEKALDDSNALMDRELHAMKLISLNGGITNLVHPLVRDYELSDAEMNMSDQERLDTAYYLVYGTEYREEKTLIDAKIKDAIDDLADVLKVDAMTSADELRKSINELSASTFFLFVLIIALFVATSVFIVHPLKVMVNCIKEGRTFEFIGAYEFKYLAVTYNNIFEINRENKARMKYDLEHDTLTNLFSRHAFEERKEALSQSTINMALMLVDIDNFKTVNDNHGHEAGDIALRRVAETMRGMFRADDVIARIGGDEFAIMLSGVTVDESLMLGNKVDKINSLLAQTTNDEVPVTVSAGIAFSTCGYSEELFGKADAALYQSKEGGRSCYRIAE